MTAFYGRPDPTRGWGGGFPKGVMLELCPEEEAFGGVCRKEDRLPGFG